MTSAVRDAANGGDFADDVASRFGLEAHVLSGDEEARLTYLGATDTLDHDPDGAPTLVFDIGGGSTELVIGHGDRLDFHVSTQAGVVRQADRHITTDPPSAAELDAIAQDVRTILDRRRAARLSRPHRPGARRRRHADLAGGDRPATSTPTTRSGSTVTG